MIESLFKQAESMPDINSIGDIDIFLNLVGDAGVFIFFLVLGILCIFYLKNTMPKEEYNHRRKVTQLLGAAIFGAAISRGLNILAMWHNFYFLNGIVKIITTIFSFSVFIYLPFAVKAIKQNREIESLKDTIKDTTEKIDKLTGIGEKIIERVKNV